MNKPSNLDASTNPIRPTSPSTPASPDNSVKDAKELRWKQYALHVDLYKTHLDMVLKVDGFYCVAIGGILSYFFSKVGADSQITPHEIKHVLWFPILVSALLALVFIYGLVTLRVVREEVSSIRDKLDLDTAPELHVLSALLILSAIMMGSVVCGLVYLLRKY